MPDEMIEDFFSGFCRTCNGMQTVTCEYRRTVQKLSLEMMNCAHEKCLHHAACEIYRQAHEKERTGQ